METSKQIFASAQRLWTLANQETDEIAKDALKDASAKIYAKAAEQLQFECTQAAIYARRHDTVS